ncbi:3-deoxy-D-manno-octulosonic acid transferase [Wenxinia saemankumensis]|uniref:3-deoxy-D-manno-octulosonic acid transferase n=1 Tax=Wenxinia saemankumensis TaxID=1447782 RepID=A0A1M6AZU5_9RHOB|nr:glycosyltransferase N-terminal domain-containing protein [Wenxinia saemankumensis]SHI42000.1 3-deoxy-D-manno-octulosonic-acid transferase [Wenxinia saemankumensis]
MPLPLALYSAASRLAGPMLGRRAAGRLAAAGVPSGRLAERRGRAGLKRPDGPVIWLHGASVGEGVALLPLVARLQGRVTCLVTTGTAASAEVLARRLPEGAIHQFAPIDTPSATRRFLDHWRPAALVLSESEIWPSWLAAVRGRGIPAALVGARLSDGSLRGWSRFPLSAAWLFGGLALVQPQSAAIGGQLAMIGVRPEALRPPADLKAAAPPLPGGDAPALAPRLAGRPVWAMLSTHAGEEALALAAHEEVLREHPGALLLLAPRHPDRFDTVADEIGGALPLARRSRGEVPGPDVPVWLCDTLGEIGTWLHLAQVVALAGSWRGAGGHNPWEPARLGRGVLHGPDIANAASAHAALAEAGGAREVPADGIGAAVSALLGDAPARAAFDAAALTVAERQGADVDSLAEEILSLAERAG